MHVNLTIPRKVVVLIASLFLVAVVSTIAACTNGTNATPALSENDQSGQIWNHYNQVQPLLQPTGLSQYRTVLTDAEATHILGLNTHTFFLRQGGNGGPMFDCSSLGSAVPNTAQLSNPDYITPDPNEGTATQPGSLLVGNMDPDGLYPPSASQGTYVMCLHPDGKPYLAYSEPNVVQLNVTGAVWDPSLYGGQGGIRITGDPVMPVCQVRTIGNPNYQGSAQASSSSTAAPAAGAVDTTDPTLKVTNCKAPK